MTEVVSLVGVVPVVPTPFHPDESIDVDSLRQVVDWIANKDLAAMCLPAYGSEFYKLSEAERDQVVSTAIEANKGRIPVIAQANHASVRLASELARRYSDFGADVISFAIPRQFGASVPDLLNYCETIANATLRPILIQDFNPGGTTIGVDFVTELSNRVDNFKFVKLEDPMMLDKLIDIRDQVKGRVRVLEGWGGLYMLEGISAGIDAVMPGAAIADLLDVVFSAAHSGDHVRAYDLFGSLLPFISFTLQDFEYFLQIEKRLLVRRGLIESATVRSLTNTPSPVVLTHIDYLLDQIERIIAVEKLDT
jgi:2-keto-3-deoxy-L-arabinonate dehydratase